MLASCRNCCLSPHRLAILCAGIHNERFPEGSAYYAVALVRHRTDAFRLGTVQAKIGG
jgi:hypothetical protein